MSIRRILLRTIFRAIRRGGAIITCAVCDAATAAA